MKSRTSFCNGALLKRLAVKGLPLWGAYLLLCLVVLPLSLYTGDRWRELLNVRDYVLSMTTGASQMFGAAYGLAAACMVFHWLYKSSSANFFGALPLNRATLFTTCYLAGLLFFLVPHLMALLLSVPMAFLWDMVLLKDLAIWFGVFTLTCFFYYSLAVLLAMIVGNLAALPVLYAIVNFMAVVVEAVVCCLLEYFIYGLAFRGDLKFAWASPFYYTMLQGDGMDVQRIYDETTGAATDIVFEGWTLILSLAAVGLVFSVLAFLIHKHRRMESAGDVIAVQHLKPVMLYCFTVGCSIVLGCGLAELLLSGSIGTEDFVGVLLCMLVGAFVGYFGGQMLLHKSMRVFRKRYWANWAVTCLLITAAMLCARFDLFGYASYVPDPADVKAVGLSYSGSYYEDPAFVEEVVRLHQACLDRQQETEQLQPEDGYSPMYLRYERKDGSVVARQYLLPMGETLAKDENSLIRMYETVYNDPDYRVIRRLPAEYTADSIESCVIIQSSTGENVWLSRQEAYTFLKTCVEPDLRESSMEEICFCGYHGSGKTDLYSGVHVEITFRREAVSDEERSRFCYLGTTSDAVRILEYAAEKGIYPTTELN